MINEPPVDVLIKELGTEDEPASRYALCVVAAKRARIIMARDKQRGNIPIEKPLTEAGEEIADGRVKLGRD